MQIDGYVQDVQVQLAAAAALGDERVREIAATLASAASPAIRLAVLAALAAAAQEITAALLDSPGAPVVAVRLDTDEIRIAVTSTAVGPPLVLRPDEADASARISLRLSEGLKAEVDDAATRAGVSVNTWLVRAATMALGAPYGDPHRAGDPHRIGGGQDRHGANAHRVTGWING